VFQNCEKRVHTTILQNINAMKKETFSSGLDPAGPKLGINLPGIPVWKRPLDCALTLLALPFWLPVFLLTALWIDLVSKGGVFFRQERIGYGGQAFSILKFRTMHKGADTCVHEQYLEDLIKSGRPMTKLDSNDKRLIRGGRFLRATGLDELPQLLNVLRGDMSLVGPRPCTPAELSKYEPSYWKRFNGLPGITGLWQVKGKNKTTFRRMIALDVTYLRRATLGMDFWILFRTLPTIFDQVGELATKRREARRKRNQVAAPAPFRLPQPEMRQATEIFQVAKNLMTSTQRLTEAPSGHTERIRFRPDSH
jgi:exopolysaccharide production protein ExoY